VDATEHLRKLVKWLETNPYRCPVCGEAKPKPCVQFCPWLAAKAYIEARDRMEAKLIAAKTWTETLEATDA
jgi:hypothetical protein